MKRDWMIAMREEMGLSRLDMAQRCECSLKLICYVEAGSITHPDIASNIARAYGMSVAQYNQLVDESRRTKSIPAYKPSKKNTETSLFSYGGGI